MDYANRIAVKAALGCGRWCEMVYQELLIRHRNEKCKKCGKCSGNSISCFVSAMTRRRRKRMVGSWHHDGTINVYQTCASLIWLISQRNWILNSWCIIYKSVKDVNRTFKHHVIEKINFIAIVLLTFRVKGRGVCWSNTDTKIQKRVLMRERVRTPVALGVSLMVKGLCTVIK
jgi:hypothetical protein